MGKKIAIFCAGSLGKELYDFLKMDKYSDIVFIDDVTKDTYYYDAKIYKFEEFKRVEKDRPIIIATGEPIYRKKIKDIVKESGCTLGKYISSKAIIGSNTLLADGAIILPNVYVGHGASVGENATVHCGALIEEGVSIGADCFVSLGAFIGAKTKIGYQCFIGPNSTTRDSITIDDCCTVGMGSCVTKSLTKGIYVGNPARMLSEKHELIF